MSLAKQPWRRKRLKPLSPGAGEIWWEDWCNSSGDSEDRNRPYDRDALCIGYPNSKPYGSIFKMSHCSNRSLLRLSSCGCFEFTFLLLISLGNFDHPSGRNTLCDDHAEPTRYFDRFSTVATSRYLHCFLSIVIQLENMFLRTPLDCCTHAQRRRSKNRSRFQNNPSCPNRWCALIHSPWSHQNPILWQRRRSFPP